VRRHLVPFFGGMKLDAIGDQEIERFKAQQLRALLSPKTVNNELTVIRKMLVTAKKWRRIAYVPEFEWLRVPEAKFDFLDRDESRRLIDTAEPEWRPMILVGLRAGLRQGELLALSWDDVDLQSGRLVVRHNMSRGVVGTPKGGRSREVPLGDDVAVSLREMPSRFARGLVFRGEAGRHLKKGECKWPLWRACAKAGLRRVGWHVLRHSFASQLVMGGVPLKAVQELLGHATIEMTMRYAHLSSDVRRDAVRTLDPDLSQVTVGAQSEAKKA